MKDKPYASLVGSLMYVHVCTRPDIAYSVGILGRFQTNPGHAHWVVGKKVLRYLQKTKDYMLVYKKIDGQELVVFGFSDVDFVGKQKTSITTSTMYAEFVALYEATIHGVWLRNFIRGMKAIDTIHRPLPIYCDNSAAVFFSKNNMRSSKSKFVDPKYMLVREKVKLDEISVEHVSSEDMLADPFTKPLSVAVFKEHVKNMGLVEFLDVV
ncbi:secreted RxLR effector protein 161-like [Rosa rugosa]|uniref:secreted RxLR effector protein 161-like n=1 Tax=Rosa rugosa TaxID=74645 RepID=UPI002B414569|nr:secreted RxLR effector protein 161-like [Rosa rugosa]